PDEMGLAPLPGWLLALCQDTTRREAPSAGEPIPQGHRNQTLFQLGCSLRVRGFTETVILAALGEMNATQCHPPLDEAEVRTIAASCAKYDISQAREDAHQRQNGHSTPDTQGGSASAPPAPGAARQLRVTSLATVMPDRVHWLWKPYLPL